jgi:hypothetical protein
MTSEKQSFPGSNFQETLFSKDNLSMKHPTNQQNTLVTNSGNVVINDFLSRERQISNTKQYIN